MKNPSDDNELFEIALRHLTGTNSGATDVDFGKNEIAEREIQTRLLQLSLVYTDDDMSLLQRVLYHRVKAHVLSWQLETAHLLKL